jgi:type I restriction enzyme M protein
MTIVLPHGVLFRGGEEGEIRKKLIEGNHIDAIIGLPANIFFGTTITTIIMVLRQRRDNTDVLIIDAFKGFEKAGKNNKLRASDIERLWLFFLCKQFVFVLFFRMLHVTN